MTYNIENRRYIGNKFKLLDFIDYVIKTENLNYSSVCDIFAGTGIVSKFFLDKNKNLIINDFLYSNFVFYNAWFLKSDFDIDKIKYYINYYNTSKDYIKENYFSINFSNTYYSYNNALIIGSIREHIENNKKFFNDKEYYILLSSLLYSADSIANTVGHYESFLSKQPKNNTLKLKMLNIIKYDSNIEIYNQDANKLIKNIKCDLLYLDPPYNSRQYINFYHILENLAEWKKPKVFGKTLKMERENKKSEYSKSKAKYFLEDLILNSNCKYILISYNNTYDAKSISTINKIKEEEIIEILSKKGGIIKKYEKDYRYFNSGKTNFKNHKEQLYLLKIK